MNELNKIKYNIYKNQVLNWDLIKKYDFKYGIQKNIKLNSLIDLANNIKHSNLKVEDLLKIKDPNLVKLFQLSQYIIEKLTYPESELFKKLNKIFNNRNSLENIVLKKKEELKKNDLNLNKLKYKLNNKLQILKQVKENNNLILYKKCILCHKIFENIEYLEKHINKRHKYDIIEYSHYNKIKKVNKDVIKNFKILKESIINNEKIINKKKYIEDQKIIKKSTVLFNNEKKKINKKISNKNIKILNKQKSKIKLDFESKIEIIENDIDDIHKSIYNIVQERNKGEIIKEEFNTNFQNNEFLDNQIQINFDSFLLKKFKTNKEEIKDYKFDQLNELYEKIKIIKKSKIIKMNEMKLIQKYNNIYKNIITKKFDNSIFFDKFDEQKFKDFNLKYNINKNTENKFKKKKIKLNIIKEDVNSDRINIKTSNSIKNDNKKYKIFDFRENDIINKKNQNYFNKKNLIFEEDLSEEEEENISNKDENIINNNNKLKINVNNINFNIKENNQDLFDFY